MPASRAIVPLKAEDLPRAIQMMGRAFADDPLARYIVPDPAAYKHFAPALVGFFVKFCFQYGMVYTTAALEGAACWLRPGDEASLVRLLRVGFIPLIFQMGWNGFQRSNKFIALAETIHKDVMPQPHWYLWALGVEPALQGQGIASALLQPVFARADADSVSCYLETQSEKNLPFYEQHGFTVARHAQLSDGANRLKFWAMRRQPHQTH